MLVGSLKLGCYGGIDLVRHRKRPSAATVATERSGSGQTEEADVAHGNSSARPRDGINVAMSMISICAAGPPVNSATVNCPAGPNFSSKRSRVWGEKRPDDEHLRTPFRRVRRQVNQISKHASLAHGVGTLSTAKL